MKKKLLFFLFLVTCTLKPKLESDNLHRYMWANFNQFAQNMQPAAQWYENAFSHQAPVYAHHGYIYLLNDMGNHKKIVELIPHVDQELKNDPNIQLIFVSALQQTGKLKEADTRLMDLQNKFKHHPEITFYAAQTYIRRKELENASRVLLEFLNGVSRKPNNYIFHFLLAQIYTQLNKPKDALVQAQEALKLHPRFDKGWLLLGLLEENAGALENAIKGYTTYLEVTTNRNAQIEQHLLHLAIKQKMAEQKRDQLLMNKDCFEKALILFEQKQYKLALANVNECLNKHPQNTESRLLKVQIETALNNFKTVRTILKQWILENPTNDIWYKTLYLTSKAGEKRTNIITTLEEIETQVPNALHPHLYLADLLTREHEIKKAIEHHKKSLQLTNDKSLETRIGYQIGVLYYHLNDYENMKMALENIPTKFPPALNLHAYYYATKGKDLSRAQALLTTALNQDKSNPHFLDTQALIWYKQKKYKKALQLFESLAQINPKDAIIRIHIGKTQNKLANAPQALKTMQHAQTIAHNDYEKKTTAKYIHRWSKA